MIKQENEKSGQRRWKLNWKLPSCTSKKKEKKKWNRDSRYERSKNYFTEAATIHRLILYCKNTPYIVCSALVLCRFSLRIFVFVVFVHKQHKRTSVVCETLHDCRLFTNYYCRDMCAFLHSFLCSVPFFFPFSISFSFCFGYALLLCLSLSPWYGCMSRICRYLLLSSSILFLLSVRSFL